MSVGSERPPTPEEMPVYEVERDRHGLMYSGPLEVGECVPVVPLSFVHQRAGEGEGVWTLLIGPAGIGVLPGEHRGYEGVERVVVVARGDTDCERCKGSGRESQDDGLMLTEGDCVACGGSGSAQRAGEPISAPDEVERAAEVIYERTGPSVICPWDRVDDPSKEKWRDVARAALGADRQPNRKEAQ